jgi:hypothetical protein
MATERRASERARRTLLLALTLAGAATAAGCRQTVILDPAANGDGGLPTGAAGTGGGIGGQDGGIGGQDAGIGGQDGGPGGFRFDAGRFDVLGNLCPTGPIQVLQAVPRTPDVIISVDRSAPMQAWWGTESRLEAVQQQVRALVQQYDKAVHFGYEEFPANNAMCGNGQGCCAGQVTPPQQRNRNAIENVLNACNNGGPGCSQSQRPAGDALSKINKTFTSFGAPNMSLRHSRYVVLVLGGDPTCGEQGGGGNTDSGVASSCDTAVTEVQKLNALGIFTTVFGVGDEATNAACLKDLSVNGGLTPTVHLALTPSALADAMTTTVSTMAEEACVLDVLTPPVDNRTVSLYFDNDLVPNDPTNGWDFDAGTTLKITVRGRWCDTLLHTTRVDLIAGCVPPRH